MEFCHSNLYLRQSLLKFGFELASNIGFVIIRELLFQLRNCNKIKCRKELETKAYLTSRQTKFKSKKSNNLKVGLNALANRLYILNNQIPITWLDGGYETFKVKSKEMFLKM